MADRNFVTVAGGILHLLRSQVMKDTAELWDAADDFKHLEDTISTIKAFLTDAENQQVQSDKVKRFIRDLEDVIYDTDDLVDQIFTVALQRQRSNMSGAKKVSSIVFSSNPFSFDRKMCRQVKKAAKKISKIWEGFPSRTNEETGVQPRDEQRTSSLIVDEEEVIGRNGDKMKIIKLILEAETTESEDLVRVIPVVGVEGIGKTTLAQLVYNDPEVRSYFDMRMWACISDLFDARSILHRILDRHDDGPQMDQLQKELRKRIDGKRFLLVLDDMVDENRENWLTLKNLLIGCAKGSCVLVTTRSENIANITRTVPVEPHYLDGLTEADSWVVLKGKAFLEREEEEVQELEEIGRVVAAKCKGVPLFICEIASIMRFTRTLNQCQDFYFEEKVIERRSEVGVEDVNETPFESDTHSYVREEDVIGRNVHKTEIIELMMQQPEIKSVENNVRVIHIVGVQGIGKTTLAQFVYNDKEVEQNYELRMWVCISNLFDARLIVHKLTEAATGVPWPKYLPMDQLQKALRDKINGKRFFLVLDNMVDVLDDWLSLQHSLMGCAKGSCVLVTTRSETVAKITRTVQPYNLDRLTEQDSWALLKRYAFHSSQEQHALEIEKLRRDIEAKCQGVPLFVRAVAHSLYLEPLDNWRYFDVENVLTGLKREASIQSELNAKKTRDANELRRQTHSFIPQEVVIGRDDEKKMIKEQLLKENLEENVMVIPIVGIGGLGKTALTQLIFNDEEVQRHFYHKIWVCITEVFDLREIVEKIILSMMTERPNLHELDSLADHLRQELQGKQYLLILDDMWYDEEDKWKQLKAWLSVGAKGSRIIVTTRSTKVAEITGDTKPHNLSILDEEMSWSLFTKVAFEQRQQPTDSEIIKIGKEIVEKCGGIPLVIRTIGSILYSKDPETEWRSFYDKELSKILENATTVEASLRLSYDHLSPPLKVCFAYCGLFPKDYEIDVETLVTLWMSQGFIDPDSGENLEDVGYDYFLDLLQRSFFQETEKEGDKIRKCKLQNLMRDLARLVAGNACSTLSSEGANFETSPHQSLARHVSFHFHLDSSWQIPPSLAELKRIRSLILPRQFRWAIEGRSNESICDGFIKLKFLRMLDLHNSGMKVLPNSIGELRHLRYLDLSQNVNIKALPNSIGRLQNLQTLKLNHCSNLRTFPRDITKLVSLRNLENGSCYSLTKMPEGLSKLVNLRTLSEFVLSKGTGSVSKQSCNLNELNELNHLRGKLKITHLRLHEGDEMEEDILSEKTHLISLTLIWDIDHAPVDQADFEKLLGYLKPHPNLRELSLTAYDGVNFSSWLPSHTNLVKFSLSRCITCQSLPPVNHLPSLQVLIVDKLTKLEYISEFRNESERFFESLKELRLTNLPNLKRWWKDAADGDVGKATFPRLSKLIVEDCPDLTSMPLFPSLEELLVLKNTSWEPFQQTMAAAASSSSTSSTVASLSKLGTICITNMSNGDPNMWQYLPSLHSLTLDHLANINALLEGLQRVTSLQQLHIWRCDSLEKIPSWISDFKSLNTVSIKLCPKLTIPPDRISLITSLKEGEISLKKVDIDDCPQVSHIERMLKDRFRPGI